MGLSARLRRVALQGVGLALEAEERLRTGVAWNPLAPGFNTNPHPALRALRERDPVHRSRLLRGWVLTRYDDCAAVLRDERFSSDEHHSWRYPTLRKQLIEVGEIERVDQPPMLLCDPPRHTRLRGLVSKALTPHAVRALVPRIEAVVAELLDSVDVGKGFDAIQALAHPLPVIVIAELLGVPARDREFLKHWSDEAVRSLGPGTLDDLRRSAAASRELMAYFEGMAEQRRDTSGEDLLSSLLRVEEKGEHLSMQELRSICQLVLVAGHETTANLLGNGLHALLSHPEQWRALCEDPDRVDTAVEELLRWEPPVTFTIRHVKEDLEFGGREFRRGEDVVTLIAAANRDPDRFEDPDRLDLTRRENPHLSFGNGIHFCLGATLARLEARVAFLALTRRFPQLRLARPRPDWGSHTLLRGLKSLPVTL